MEELKKCHFIGIGGIGMSGLAHILMQQNCAVSGSDLALNDRIKALSSEGAYISLKHDPENIPNGASIVYTSMVNDKNPEFQFAKKSNFPLLHRSDLLKILMKGAKPLLVSGSHGKTTTSALLAWTLQHAEFDPTYAIGGVLLNTGTNARKGRGNFFVAEADESDGTFIKYHAHAAILTNISHEHMDFYKNEPALLSHFKKFIDNTESLFWCYDDKLLQAIKPKGVSYGFGQCRWQASNFRQEESCICFDACYEGRLFKDISLGILGRHNALNALAVFGLCLSLGIQEEKIREAFLLFKGASRRMEHKGEAKGVLVIDDYAHHPKEIETTISTLRAAYPWRRIVVLYQPHRYSRTLHCKGSFGGIFKAADLTLVTDIYDAMEEPIEGIDSFTVINEVQSNCFYLPKDRILTEIPNLIKPLDILLVLGAGDITSFCKPMIKCIQDQLPRLKLGLIYGGRSKEHEISLLSARSVAAGIDPSLFETLYFAVDQEGKWLSDEKAKNVLSGCFTSVPKSDQEKMMSSETLEKLLQCDLAFPVMHGPYGEDGKVQGLLETLGIPHMNCSSKALAVSMDKAMLKKIAHYHGLPILPFIDFSSYDWQMSKQEIINKIASFLSYPLFVKPVHLGSTIGVVKVSEPSKLESGIDYSLSFDSHIIVETGVEGREIEFAIFGEGAVRVFAPGEIMVSGQVYDYEGKYGDSAVAVNPAAELPESAIEEGMDLAARAYKAACCDGFARVDFFYDKEGKFFLNEINPIPGFTINSLYPKVCAKNNVSYPILIKHLAAIGLSKQRKHSKLL